MSTVPPLPVSGHRIQREVAEVLGCGPHDPRVQAIWSLSCEWIEGVRAAHRAAIEKLQVELRTMRAMRDAEVDELLEGACPPDRERGN